MKHYLYRHIRKDTNTPFYIGIGTQGRYNSYERANVFTKRNKRWENIFKHSEIEVQILLESDNIEYIKEKEIEFIKLYGREDKGGVLANYTDGGDGVKGKIVSEELKYHLSKINRGNKHPQYGTKASDLTKKKQSLSKRGARSKTSIPVICLNNNKRYESMGEASFYIYGDRKLRKKISDIIKNKRKTYKGYSFKLAFDQSFDDFPHVELINL